ncbi:hypothetical protein ACIOHC_40800 [Streptomyces sp. NPDC088252]|uniref:hypothetical protein n=1 Tax=Streptomyces sp. NPDC088252 TaxID=3365845 RepID=UPI0037FEFE44
MCERQPGPADSASPAVLTAARIEAARYGGAVLYAGTVELTGPTLNEQATAQALRTAVQAGQLVGARITIGVLGPAQA